VLDDLLDVPLIGGCGRAKLSPGGVQSLEGSGYLLLKLLEDRVHERRINDIPGMLESPENY
jgi:hypothetical protein